MSICIMNICISIHSIVAIRSRLYNRKESCWVDLQFYDKDGKMQEVSIFFDDHDFAARFGHALAALEATEPTHTPTPINPDIPF